MVSALILNWLSLFHAQHWSAVGKKSFEESAIISATPYCLLVVRISTLEAATDV